MINYIAAFRSRSQTMTFFQTAKKYNIPCAVVNTPREASVGCGISVSFAPEYFAQMRNVYSRGIYNSFIGWYKMSRQGNSVKVEPV